MKEARRYLSMLQLCATAALFFFGAPVHPALAQSGRRITPQPVTVENSGGGGGEVRAESNAVRQIIVTRAEFEGGAGSWKETEAALWAHYNYDPRGLLLRESIYATDGSFRRRVFYKYDAKGNKISEAVFGAHGYPLYQYAFTYDAEGRIVGDIYYAYDGTAKYKGLTLYDENGHKIKSVRYTANASLSSDRLYNAAGQVTEEKVYKEKELLAYRIAYRYDAAGRRSEEAYYLASGKLCNESRPDQSRRVYSYDEAGNLVEEQSYNPDNSVSWKKLYSYDAAGRLTGEAHYSRGTTLLCKRLYTYELDQQGNWVKRIMSETTTAERANLYRPVEVLYREITYR